MWQNSPLETRRRKNSMTEVFHIRLKHSVLEAFLSDFYAEQIETGLYNGAE